MIKVKDSTEFERLLKALADDIVNANIYYKLYRDVHQSLCDHPLVTCQSNTFWQLTLNAYVNTSMQTLCRVYDQNPVALNLNSWLLTIQKYLHLFDNKEFQQRLKDNPFMESLAKAPRKPEPTMLSDDIRLCSLDDPLVKTLIIHRHNHVAHLAATNILSASNLHDTHPLTFRDLEELLTRAKTILNRYSSLWSANTYSTQVIGHDDYQFIFKSVEEKVQHKMEVFGTHQ